MKPSPKYIVDHHGNRIAVILPIDEYNRLLEASGGSADQDSAASEAAAAKDQEAYTEEEEQILKNRLKALGYL
ncbi:MAG: hypothetical protein QGI83_00100 [Candidatus Latescibacteria bacterium]|jgi:hypothetical protein|nr:hypothetical protein [Candidatus Latescibacterota bacterium]